MNQKVKYNHKTHKETSRMKVQLKLIHLNQMNSLIYKINKKFYF